MDIVHGIGDGMVNLVALVGDDFKGFTAVKC